MKDNNNLLTSLYKWAPRQDENFTSEAFVHLLNYLLEHEAEMVAVILQKMTNGFLSLSETMSRISEIEICSQPITSYGRPDIKIETPDKLIYLEVKVESGLGHEQLNSYRQALQESGKRATFLILLSRYAITSESEQPDYTVRWYEIADWLENELENRVNQPVSRYVIEQFLGYLKEKHMTITQVKSGISSGVRTHQALGIESILLRRNRSLSKLANYPELLPLYNLLMMMGEALTNLSLPIKPKFDSGQQQGGWIGYNLFNLQYFVSIYFQEPEVLTFETFKYKIDRTKHDGKLGRVVTINGMIQWINTMDLASPESRFLFQSREHQIRLVEEFVNNSIRYSQLLRS